METLHDTKYLKGVDSYSTSTHVLVISKKIIELKNKMNASEKRSATTANVATSDPISNKDDQILKGRLSALLEHSATIAIVTTSDPIPVLSALCLEARRVLESMEDVLSENYRRAGVLHSYVKAQIRKYTCVMNCKFETMDWIVFSLALLTTCSSFDFIILDALLAIARIPSTNENWDTVSNEICNSAQLLRAHWYLSCNICRYEMRFFVHLVPRSIRNLYSRVTHKFFAPHFSTFPMPLEYPVDIINASIAVDRIYPSSSFAKNVNIILTPFFEEYGLIEKLKQYDQRYSDIVKASNTHISIRQSMWNWNWNWLLYLTLGGVSISFAFSPMLKILENLNFNIDKIFDINVIPISVRAVLGWFGDSLHKLAGSSSQRIPATSMIHTSLTTK